jgi:shikimate 5-dehydrogenase
VTTHKIDLFNACKDMFDYIDPYANLCGEVSCLSKKDGLFQAHAKDPIASGRALDEFVPAGHWREARSEALLFGAGGTSVAITLHLLAARKQGDRPSRVTIVDRDRARLDSMRDLHRNLGKEVPVEYVESHDIGENDEVLAGVPAGSLVVNATGMGKDTPGSPVSDQAKFPENGLVWEVNYRGELDFLRQARRQRRGRDLAIADGWRYFVHGWTSAIAEIFQVPINTTDLEALASLAIALR